jgi:hypothetical protein
MNNFFTLFSFLFLFTTTFITEAAVPIIENSTAVATTFKFTTALNTPLTKGNKIKIDYGKGLSLMTCTTKICTLSSNFVPGGTDPVDYQIGVYDTKNILQSTLQNGTYNVTNMTTTLNTVDTPIISDINITGTTFKFTAKLSNALTTGYKVKIDYGFGLSNMTCSATTCTFSSKSIPNNSNPLTYNIGVYNSKNILQGVLLSGTYTLSSINSVKNSTVVIRVVGTNPEWGQEENSTWSEASPVKDAEGYKLYDLEIGHYIPPKEIAKSFTCVTSACDTPAPVTSYVTLYKFSNKLLDKKATSIIRSIPVQAIENSSQTAQALKTLFNLILDKENPTRIVIAYAGHGSPWSTFEGSITFDEGAELFDSIRQKKPGIPLILDFSTNCSVGYFDFAVHYFNHADYLLASDKNVGGYTSNVTLWYPGSPEEISWNAADHNFGYDKFFKPTNSVDQAFSEIITARQNNWLLGSNSIKADNNEQSLSIYKLSEFENLMRGLKSNGFNPALDLSQNFNDLATYAYNTKNSTLISQLEKFRIYYASDRNIANWVDDSKGFSVAIPEDLQRYLDDMN